MSDRWWFNERARKKRVAAALASVEKRPGQLPESGPRASLRECHGGMGAAQGPGTRRCAVPVEPSRWPAPPRRKAREFALRYRAPAGSAGNHFLFSRSIVPSLVIAASAASIGAFRGEPFFRMKA